MSIAAIEKEIRWLAGKGISVSSVDGELHLTLRDGQHTVSERREEGLYIVVSPSHLDDSRQSVKRFKDHTAVVAFIQAHNRALLWEAIARWLLTAPGRNCKAARAILFFMTGDQEQIHPDEHPQDTKDLRACFELLEAFPEFSKAFPKMADVDPIWKQIIAAWEDLDGLYREEMLRPGDGTPRTYDELQKRIAQGFVNHPDWTAQLNERGHLILLTKKEHQEA